MIRDFFMVFLMIFYIFMKLIFLPKKKERLDIFPFCRRCVQQTNERKIVNLKCRKKCCLQFISISF